MISGLLQYFAGIYATPQTPRRRRACRRASVKSLAEVQNDLSGVYFGVFFARQKSSKNQTFKKTVFFDNLADLESGQRRFLDFLANLGSSLDSFMFFHIVVIEMLSQFCNFSEKQKNEKVRLDLLDT